MILAERERLQKDKDGHEVDQGLFLSQVLSHRLSGAHLVHAMLRPLAAALDHLTEFQQTGRLDVANGRTRDAIEIVERCEARDAAAVQKARRGWFKRLFG